jgi:flagellar motor switch protein FliN/FliY
MADDSSEKAVSDVTVELSVVLGRAEMPIHQLLKMGRGAVIELDATVDSDVGIFANNRLISRGDVMVAGENIAVSITENIVASEE